MLTDLTVQYVFCLHPPSPLFILLEEGISIVPHIDVCVYMLKWSDKVHSVYL